MANINTLIDAFYAQRTLSNAKKLVNHVAKHPMVACMITGYRAGLVEEAKTIIADAKDPKKTKEAMQRELQARFKGMNIIVC